MEHFISNDEARRRHEALRNLARHLVSSAEDAEDAIQETWLARLNQVREPIHNHEGWLRRVLRRKVGLQHRQRTSRAEHERRAARPEAQPPEDSVVQRDLAATLNAALDDLREPYSTVLRLRYIEQLSERGICEALDRPLTTVKSQITRGLALLRQGLDGRFEDERATWTGMILSLLFGARSGLRGTGPVLAVVAGGLVSLQLAVSVALESHAAEVAQPSARPAAVAEASPGVTLSEAYTAPQPPQLASPHTPLEVVERQGVPGLEIDRPHSESVTLPPQRAASRTARNPAKRERTAKRERRQREPSGPRTLPLPHGDDAHPVYFAGRVDEQPERELTREKQSPRRKRGAVAKGKSKKRRTPGTTVTNPGSGGALGGGVLAGGGPGGGGPKDVPPGSQPSVNRRPQVLSDQLRGVPARPGKQRLARGLRGV